MKENYQIVLDDILGKIVSAVPNAKPKLLLHACCAPCSSYVLEYLSQYFDITVLYYNPNIYPEEEYEKRFGELRKLVRLAPFCSDVKLIEGKYDSEEWLEYIKGTEEEREGGKRCARCFRKRLIEAAKAASELGCDYFCTTLTVSPHKNAQMLNEIGKEVEREYGVPFLPSDFKKRNGYKRTTEICAEYGIYRQNYCGCRFSMWFNKTEKSNETEKMLDKC